MNSFSCIGIVNSNPVWKTRENIEFQLVIRESYQDKNNQIIDHLEFIDIEADGLIQIRKNQKIVISGRIRTDKKKFVTPNTGEELLIDWKYILAEEIIFVDGNDQTKVVAQCG